jgi:hypothetical protein
VSGLRWWRKWAVYIPLTVEAAATMDQLLVFEDADGQWWGERIGVRYWTRRAARRAAFEEHKRRFRMHERYAELGRQLGVPPVGVDEERLLPGPRAGRAGESRVQASR